MEKTQALTLVTNQRAQAGFLADTSSGCFQKIEGQLVIGRSPDCEFRLCDAHASLRHCKIERRGLAFFVCDLKSRNGTWVNGIRVNEAELIDGSRIQVGKTVFLFELREPETMGQRPLPMGSKDPHWSATLRQLPTIISSDLPVFIQGESGTGKEVIARLLHDFGPRSKKPFISVNCSALTETLVESELFGHIKGSFTGATSDRKGAFESARGGTLFLDEIGDLPLTLQPKLLRALENHEIRPVGSDKIIPTDVRIVAATHKNLESLVSQKMFRSDLYFRLNVLKIAIPSLRERLADFDDLLYTFCKEYRTRFSVAAIEVLKKHKWPGNIRELKNAVARASALFPKTYIQPDHVPQILGKSLNTFDDPFDGEMGESFIPKAGDSVVKSIERELIRRRLLANQGNQRRTAAELGIPKSTLHDRIKHYNIDMKSLMVREVLEENPTYTARVENAVDIGG